MVATYGERAVDAYVRDGFGHKIVHRRLQTVESA